MRNSPEDAATWNALQERSKEGQALRRCLKRTAEAASTFAAWQLCFAENDEDDDFAEDSLQIALALTWFSSTAVVEPAVRIDFASLSPVRCYSLFRFHKADIPAVIAHLRMPASMRCDNGLLFTSLEGFLIMTRSLAYPIRLVDLHDLFRRPEDQLSNIFNTTIRWLVAHWGSLLNGTCLDRARAESYRASIRAHTGLPNLPVFGFLDGTIRRIRRPAENQGVMYNGHKHVHALKYLAVQTPDGLMQYLFGPWEGCRHDSAMLEESGLLAALDEKFPVPQDAEPAVADLTLYGDSGFPLSERCLTPFRRLGITPQQIVFNRLLSSSRVSVEWGLGKNTRLWKSLTFLDGQVLGLRPLAVHYKGATLLSNLHTCLYWSQTSHYFNCPPPTVEVYLASRDY